MCAMCTSDAAINACMSASPPNVTVQEEAQPDAAQLWHGMEDSEPFGTSDEEEDRDRRENNESPLSSPLSLPIANRTLQTDTQQLEIASGCRIVLQPETQLFE